MVFEIPRGKTLRLSSRYGPTDSRDRDWQFRNSRLHDGLMDRVEGFGSSLDFARFGNMPTTSQMRPGAPLANTDMPNIQLKNRYNAKSQPWLQAYDPVPETWEVEAAGSSQPFLAQRAQGSLAGFHTLYADSQPSTGPCPCSVQTQWPAQPSMNVQAYPPTCVSKSPLAPDVNMPLQDGMQIMRVDGYYPPAPGVATAPTPTAHVPRHHFAHHGSSGSSDGSSCASSGGSHHPRPSRPTRPTTTTPFSGGYRGASGAGDRDDDGRRPVYLTFVVPTWGLCVAGVLVAFLFGFAIYGVVKALGG
jgi:hypothetical protein